MPSHSHHTRTEEISQEIESQDDWTKEVLPRLPSGMEEQARKHKAFQRCREIRSAADLLRGLLAYVYTAHSFQHLSMWSLLLGIADVSANDWRKRLRKASAWLDWLLQEVLAMSSSVAPTLVRAGVRRILLIDGTHWKCFGPTSMVWRVHTAFDLLTGRLTQVKVTDRHEAEHLEVFDLQKGDLVVTDRANGLRIRINYVLSRLADIVVRISAQKFPMEDEHGVSIAVRDWLVGLNAQAGESFSRPVWMRYENKRIKLRLIVLRLSPEQQQRAERRRKRIASKRQMKIRESTLYLSGWVLLVTTLPQQDWSDRHILCLYQARWHIELLFKRMKQLLKRQSLRCKTAATAKATITLLLLGWSLLEEEAATVRLAIRDAMHCAQRAAEANPLGPIRTEASWWQDDPDAPLSEWMLAEACFDLFCQQIRGSYTTERFRACLPRLQRFLRGSRRKRPHLYTQVCLWLGIPPTLPEDRDQALIA